MNTVSAVARLMPCPPAFVDSRKTSSLAPGALKASIRFCRTWLAACDQRFTRKLRFQVPSRRAARGQEDVLHDARCIEGLDAALAVLAGCRQSEGVLLQALLRRQQRYFSHAARRVQCCYAHSMILWGCAHCKLQPPSSRALGDSPERGVTARALLSCP